MRRRPREPVDPSTRREEWIRLGRLLVPYGFLIASIFSFRHGSTLRQRLLAFVVFWVSLTIVGLSQGEN